MSKARSGDSHSTPAGLLNLMKPRGITSHDAVARVRRLTHVREVGHVGTLDPDACGVLPIAVGSSYTKLIQWLELTPKIYRGWMELGVSTSSGDASGVVVGRSGPPWPTRRNAVSSALWLVGDHLQIPPRVSALKHDGKRLYQLARQGRAVWPSPRLISVASLKVLNGDGQRWYFEASVGAGTYIRSLVRDWGWLLRHSAHLEDLERTGVGSFAAAHSWSFQQLEEMGDQWTSALETYESHLSIAVHNLDPDVIPMIAHGRRDILPHIMGNAEGTVALVANRDIIAIVTGPPWRFRKVLLKDGAYGAN